MGKYYYIGDNYYYVRDWILFRIFRKFRNFNYQQLRALQLLADAKNDQYLYKHEALIKKVIELNKKRLEGESKINLKVLTKEEVEANRSNAYDYLDL